MVSTYKIKRSLVFGFWSLDEIGYSENIVNHELKNEKSCQKKNAEILFLPYLETSADL
jgi:hypothetical protein